jgi:hypothetical protein
MTPEPDLTPRTVPATEDEIDNALGHEPLDYRQGFYAGVRWAEELHKPTKEKT